MRCKTPKIRTPTLEFSELTHYLKDKVSPDHWTKGHQFKKRPIIKMRRERLITFTQKTLDPASRNLGITNDSAFPTANKKNGKTRSVGVQPCQSACCKGLNM